MLNIFTATSTPENRPPLTKTHKKRFGVIPAEPCRASSMQIAWQTPCNDKSATLAD